MSLTGSFLHFAAKFDFSRYKTLSDLGGSLGSLSVAVCQAQPHMTATTYDLPAMEGAAKKYILDPWHVRPMSGDLPWTHASNSDHEARQALLSSCFLPHSCEQHGCPCW